jgi:SAM-dependent methyltransferase
MAYAAVPDRLAWAVETMAIGPADRVLEIGCGRGVAVALICERLAGGSVTAIDRSETAIAAARTRNAAAVASGKAALAATALHDASFPDHAFTTVFAVNVNLFWVRSPAAELRLIKRWLAPGGRLHLFWDPPGDDRTAQITGTVPPLLAVEGFDVEVLTRRTSTSASLVCVVARPRP